jgi:hypothetical protein
MESLKFSAIVLRALVLAVIVFAASCGGGGGGAGGSLTYITDWTNRGRAVTGLSQRIQIFDLQNRLKKSVVMNQDSTALQQAQLGGFGKGTFRLFVELFSQRDLGGVRTGYIETLVSIGSSSSFRSSVGEDPTSVGVAPTSAAFQVGHSHQFYATGYVSPGIAAFLEFDSVTWETFGGTATVNDTGLVFGVSQGPGTVRATHQPTGHQGSAIFTVEPLQTTQSKWTVMVFLNAANDLFPFAWLNVNQMESVAQNPDVRFVIQWKSFDNQPSHPSFDGTRRYLVKPDNSPSSEWGGNSGFSDIRSELLQDLGGGIDMGDPDELHSFIQWAKAHYPADRYALVIWNHGNGWRRGPEDQPGRAVSYDDETGNAIQIWEMAQALGSHVFDILAFDASLMQMIEVAYEIQDRALFVAGSEESPPGEGYPYHLIFDNFRDNPDATTLALSKAFVDGMLEFPPYATRKITQSIVDTSKLGPLATALDGLADNLIANVAGIGSQVQSIRAAAQSYSPSSTRVYRDIDHLAELIASTITIPEIVTSANGVRTALTDAVVWEGHNQFSANSNGLSIDFSSSSQFAPAADDYALLRFANATRWNEWLLVAP